MNKQQQLIQSLTTDLQPVQTAKPPVRQALAWLLVSGLFVWGMTELVAPLRSDAVQQLLSVPRFALETLTAVAAIVCLSVAAFRSAIPGSSYQAWLKTGWVLAALWVVQYLLGLWSPAIAPSLNGERAECWLEVLLYSVPPVLAALYLTRKMYTLTPTATSLSYCLAAGMIPAALMQLACMYEVPHILQYHILPGLLVGSTGFVLAQFYRSRRQVQR